MTRLKKELKHFFLTRKILLLLGCLLLLSFSPGSASAAEATYTITETELTRLEQNLDLLQVNCQMQDQKLQTASELLKQSEQLNGQLQLQLQKANKSIDQAQASLVSANTLLNKYEQEVKRERTKLKIERDIAIIAAVFFAVRK